MPSCMISGTILYVTEFSYANEIYVYGIYYAYLPYTCTYTTFPSHKFMLVFPWIVYRKLKSQERVNWFRRKVWIPLTTQLTL